MPLESTKSTQTVKFRGDPKASGTKPRLWGERSSSSCKVISHKMIEKEMGDRGSNLKEQRINDSWRIGYILRLIYILTDFERNYLVKNQTKQFISIRLYSCKKASAVQQSEEPNLKLNP